MSIHLQGLSFFEQKIKEYLNLDVSELDFTVHPDGVYAFTDYGDSYIVTNNADYMTWFKSYEDLKYGEIL